MKGDTRLYFGEHHVDFSSIASELSDEEIINFKEMIDRISKIVDNLDDMEKWLDKFVIRYGRKR